jgi:UDPglucose 6-dehydrogenase
VFAAATQIASMAQERVLVVTKSTVPVGTGREIERIICDMRPDLVVHVASNPEFLREGNALRDFMEPDRIVIGTDDNAARHVLKCIYAPIATKGAPILFTSRAAAEVTKYAANAFLAMKISFINEISDLCEAASAEIGEVAAGIGLDHRIGRDFLRAGPGYGGSCFPKDTAALVATAQELGVRLRLVESTIAVNDMRKAQMVRRVEAALGGSVAGKSIALLGLTFKAGTDDVRASPAIPLAAALLAAGARVRAYDPAGMCHIKELPAGLELAKNSYACAESADCIVLATDWREFVLLDFNLLAEIVRGAVFVDLRNAIHPSRLKQAGFAAHGIGYPAAAATPGIAPLDEAAPVPRRKIMTPAPLSPSAGAGDAAP